MFTLIILIIIAAAFIYAAHVALGKYDKAAIAFILIAATCVGLGVYLYPASTEVYALRQADLSIKLAEKEAKRIDIISAAVKGRPDYLKYLEIENCKN